MVAFWQVGSPKKLVKWRNVNWNINRYLSNIEAINYQSKYGNRTDNKDIVEINAQLKSLEAVIAKTSKEAKKEKQINKRAKLVKKARDLQVELNNLKRRAAE